MRKVFICIILLAASFSAMAINAAPALTYNEDGKYYEVGTVDDWNTLADYVAAGNNCYNMVFKMTADIGPVQKTIGYQDGDRNQRKRFAGEFDGDNHILTVNITSAGNKDKGYNGAYTAPFAFLKAATIRNITVEGTVTASNQWGSGLVGSTGSSSSDGSCTLENCHVSVTLISNYKSTGGNMANHGGLIGIAEGATTFTNCIFDGKFIQNNGKDFNYSGGFTGLNKGSATLTNCLFNPSECNVDDSGAAQFTHDMKGGKFSTTSSQDYYTVRFGTEKPQGVQVMTEPVIGYKLTSVTCADNNEYLMVTGYQDIVLTATQAEMNGQDRYWASFYHSSLSYKLPAGALALTVSRDGDHFNLFMVGNGNIIPAGCAVIIMSLSESVTLKVTEETATAQEGNELKGSDTVVSAPDGGVYVISKVNGNFGFIKFQGDIPANKAYI